MILAIVKFILPAVVVTDLLSELFGSTLILNLSRMMRMLLLTIFIFENARLINTIKNFRYFYYFLFFSLILFLYLVLSDPYIGNGIWEFSKLLCWVLGLNFFYAYSKKGLFGWPDFLKINKNVILVSFILTLAFIFFGNITSKYNIASYINLFCLPICLVSSNFYSKHKAYLLMASFSIIVTLKRGAILSFISCNIVYIFLFFFHIKKSNILKLSSIALHVRVLTSAFILFILFYMQGDRLFERFSQEEFDLSNPQAGSGRILLYTSLINDFYNSDNIIFGFGSRASTFRYGEEFYESLNAHSDFLQFMYDYGLVGLLLIFFIYRKLFKDYYFFKNKNNNYIYFALIISILFPINIFSGAFLGSMNLLYLLSPIAMFNER